jgi:membrane protein YqaA with SNARE-associated domain
MRKVWSERNPNNRTPLNRRPCNYRCKKMNVESAIKDLQEYGPAGLFLAALVSNMIPGFPAVYLTFVGAYAAIVHDIKSQLLVVLAAGVGAGLGKVFVFSASSFLASRSKRVRRKRSEYEWLLQRGKLGIFLAVVLFASLPLPDDVLYIPLGISGFSLAWFTLGVITGKIILTFIVLALGNAYWSLAAKLFPGEGEGAVNWPLAIAGLTIGTILFTAFIFAIDWKRVYEAYSEKGLVHGTIVLLEEVVAVLTLRPIRKRLSARKGLTS